MRKRHFLNNVICVILGVLGWAMAAGAASLESRLQPVEARGSNAEESGMFNVRNYGAKGNGAVWETKSLQAAINACAQSGGGKVYLPAGTYLTGTLFLKSGVTLFLAKGAVLSASVSLSDYPRLTPALRSYTDHYVERSLIYGEGLQDVGIEGEGVIDGHGSLLQGPQKWRPYLLRLVSCRGVTVKGITLKNSAMWAQHYLACDNVTIEGITVRNRCNLNNDGLDIDACHGVRISKCDISSEDDSIVLKSTLRRNCQDVEVTDCRLSSDNNALKLGTESIGGFKNIRLSHCEIYKTHNSGLAVEMVDGGVLDGVEVSDLKMDDVEGPIFIRLGNRGLSEGAKPGVGALRNVRIRNVAASGASRIGCSITGLPGHPAENITLENIHLTCNGGSRAGTFAQTVRELPAKYPEYSMFGVLPAYGFFCRHVSGLRFTNVEVDFTRQDERPGLSCEDVSGLELAGWKGQVSSPERKSYELVSVQGGNIEGLSWVEQPKSKATNAPGVVKSLLKDSKILGFILGR